MRAAGTTSAVTHGGSLESHGMADAFVAFRYRWSAWTPDPTIPKPASIVLTPEQPSYAGGVWYVEARSVSWRWALRTTISRTSQHRHSPFAQLRAQLNESQHRSDTGSSNRQSDLTVSHLATALCRHASTFHRLKTPVVYLGDWPTPFPACPTIHVCLLRRPRCAQLMALFPTRVRLSVRLLDVCTLELDEEHHRPLRALVAATPGRRERNALMARGHLGRHRITAASVQRTMIGYQHVSVGSAGATVSPLTSTSDSLPAPNGLNMSMPSACMLRCTRPQSQVRAGPWRW